MAPFEQAWTLLKSNKIKDEEYWYDKIQEDYGEGGRYSDMAPKPSLVEVLADIGIPIEGQSKPTSLRKPNMSEDEYWEMIENMPFESRAEAYNIADQVGAGEANQMQLPLDFNKYPPIDFTGMKYKKPQRGESLRPITPLEDRVPNKPPVSHIEWNPNTGYYTLRGTKGEELSTILDGGPFSLSAIPKNPLRNYMGETPSEFRRKGYYNKLLRGLLNAGIDITSDSRNYMSNPFHRKFIDNLTPNLEVLYRTNEDNEISQLTPINYRRKQFPLTFGASDLALRDYGAVPIQSLPKNPVREPIASRQTQLDEFSPPPPPTPPVEWNKLRQTMPFGKE